MTLLASIQAEKLIRKWEGEYLTAYKCPAGIPTIGVGHTGLVEGRTVHVGMEITEAQSDYLLQGDIKSFAIAINREIKGDITITQSQFDALVSFTFNLGIGALRKSTLLRKINENDMIGAAKEFQKWVYAKDPSTGKKRKLKGLVSRRVEERALFEIKEMRSSLPEENMIQIPKRFLPLPTLQQEGLEPDVRDALVTKPVAIAGGVAVASGAIEAINQAAPTFNLLSYIDWRVGVAIVMVGAIGVGVWLWRRK